MLAQKQAGVRFNKFFHFHYNFVRSLVFEVVKLQVKSEALVLITACKDVDVYGLYACFIVL